MSLPENFIKDLIDFWREDTSHHSIQHSKHPVITILIKIGERYSSELVIKEILEHLKEKKSWILFILPKFIGEEDLPDISVKAYKNYDGLREIWLKWGEENNFIE